jgi:hypothetical protein
MKQTEVQKELERFRDYVISQAKRNLVKLKKNSSKKLYNSIGGRVKSSPNSFEMEFWMEDYGLYQDKGVNGLKIKHGSEFNFRKGKPNAQMISSLDKWIRRKGLSPRNSKGKFVNRKNYKFALARSIFNKGIARSLFFTKPFEDAYKKLPETLVEKYGLDAVKLFNDTFYQLENG